MEGTWGSPSGGCSSGACEPLGRSVHSVKGTDGDRVEEGGGRGRWGGGWTAALASCWEEI